jgi:PAS domain S-box-containing protein
MPAAIPLEAILEALPEAVVAADGTGQIVYASAAVERLLGWKASDLAARPLATILPGTALGACPRGESVPVIARARDGTEIALDVTSALRGDGADALLVAALRPQATERDLGGSQARHMKMQEIGRIGSWVSGLGDGDGLVWSDETYRIFGMPVGAPLLVESFFERVHPEDRAAIRENVQRALVGGGPYRIEHRIIRPSGEVRWVRESADVEFDGDGRPLRLMGVVQDVTEAHLAKEALERAVRARDIFLSIASHELKTPLTPLTLQLQSIDRLARKTQGALPVTTVLEKVAKAEKQVAHLSRLVEDLLFVARATEDGLELAPEPLDLSALVAEVAERFRPAFEAVGAALSVETPGPVPSMWDRLRLDQALSNLLGNALKYGRGQPVSVVLRASDEEASLSVRDRGIGIAPEDCERIFGRFERAVSDRNYGGFGLGLWIARQVVEAMGGEVEVASRLGEGSTFTVTLPRRC